MFPLLISRCTHRQCVCAYIGIVYYTTLYRISMVCFSKYITTVVDVLVGKKSSLSSLSIDTSLLLYLFTKMKRVRIHFKCALEFKSVLPMRIQIENRVHTPKPKCALDIIKIARVLSRVSTLSDA